MVRRRRGASAALLVILASSEALAEQRLVRHLDWRTAAPISNVVNLDQDADGFLWIAMPQGLLRYDGAEFRTIASEGYFEMVLGCGHSGRVRALRRVRDRWNLTEIDGVSFTTSPLPDGLDEAEGPLQGRCGEDGAVWLAGNGTLWRRAPKEGWKRIEAVAAGPWSRVLSATGTTALAAAAGRIFRVAPDGTAEALALLANPTDGFLRPDGELVALDWRTDGTHLIRARSGKVEELAFLPGRPMGLTERAGTIWAAYDRGLVEVRPDGTKSFVQSTPATVSGGALLVDREGALWIGNPRGLAQLPEPDTVAIDLPAGGRWIRSVRGALTVATWSGSFDVRAEEGKWTLVPTVPSIGAICEDAQGRTWSASFDLLGCTDLRGRTRHIPFPHVGDLAPCALDGGGAMWMPTHRGLLRLRRDGDRPEVARGEGPVYSLLFDGAGRLWAGEAGRVCVASDVERRNWNCASIGTEPVTDLVETNGRIWAAAGEIFERQDDATWHELTFADDDAARPVVSGFAPSARGGVWLLGMGPVLRVTRTGESSHLRVLERIAAWQGMPTSNTSDAVEEEDGTVWMVSPEGILVRVAGSVRQAPPLPARVAITALEVDGRPAPSGREIRLPYRRNRLEVRASAFSYRDASRLRYRLRMSEQEPWSEPTANPRFQFYNMASGRYALRFAASLDGEHWTQTEAPLVFRVDRPWFLQAWFLALAGVAAAGAAYGAHRVRVSRLVALSRQRTRIAMDLHDAIGSGLGSIGLLAGIGARPGVDAERRRELSGQIVGMASDLGMSLSEIVWSLRPGSERLEALAQYLKERAHTLFTGQPARCVTEFPAAWPDARLSLPLRRNLLLIAIEALHNVAKHAEASEVRLGIWAEHGKCMLWVQDDGLGLEHGVRPGGGMGLENMKRRAQEIDARIEWSPGSPRGTRVTLTFDPGFEEA